MPQHPPPSSDPLPYDIPYLQTGPQPGPPADPAHPLPYPAVYVDPAPETQPRAPEKRTKTQRPKRVREANIFGYMLAIAEPMTEVVFTLFLLKATNKLWPLCFFGWDLLSVLVALHVFIRGSRWVPSGLPYIGAIVKLALLDIYAADMAENALCGSFRFVDNDFVQLCLGFYIIILWLSGQATYPGGGPFSVQVLLHDRNYADETVFALDALLLYSTGLTYEDESSWLDVWMRWCPISLLCCTYLALIHVSVLASYIVKHSEGRVKRRVMVARAMGAVFHCLANLTFGTIRVMLYTQNTGADQRTLILKNALFAGKSFVDLVLIIKHRKEFESQQAGYAAHEAPADQICYAVDSILSETVKKEASVTSKAYNSGTIAPHSSGTHLTNIPQTVPIDLNDSFYGTVKNLSYPHMDIGSATNMSHPDIRNKHGLRQMDDPM